MKMIKRKTVLHKRIGTGASGSVVLRRATCGIKKIICLEIAVFTAFCMFLSAGCANEHNPKLLISQLIGIEVPDESKVLYHYCDTTFHNGRHENYTVFEFENEPIDWLKENNFSVEKDEDYEDYFLYSNFGLLELHFSENIPDEYIPDFETQYLWLQTQGVCFAYFTEQSILIVFVKPS